MAQNKILLSADTPCDIGGELKARYNVSLFPLHILLDGKQYTDGQDITSEMLFRAWWDQKLLPRTAAINPEEYAAYFAPYLEQGWDIVHISLGSGLSSCYQNAKAAAETMKDQGSVYVIDSCSLSTGFGQLVCEAGERIKAGMAAKDVCAQVQALVPRVRASFVLDTLEFLHAGGRCSGLAHISADMLSIKPTILVRNEMAGKMTVGKKYMGKLDRALLRYVDEQLKDRTDIVLDRVFITYSSIDDQLRDMVVNRVLELQPFREVFCTNASCTVSAHCGPNTLGVLYITK